MVTGVCGDRPPEPQVALTGTKYGAFLCTRAQPSLSSAGIGRQMMPRGEPSASFDWPEIVELRATSASLLMMSFHIALLDWNGTSVTSFSVRLPKAISASAPWVRAGEPTTAA